MNRSLWIPGVCSIVAFVALFAGLGGVPGRETRVSSQAASVVPRIPDAEAEQALRSLGEQYLRPWREWEQSPRHLFSRAASRPIPSVSAEVELASRGIDATEDYVLASIVIRKGLTMQAFPCVLQRSTQQVRLFADDRWLTDAEWLKSAPLP